MDAPTLPAFAPGTEVTVKNPEGWLFNISSKIKGGRVGKIKCYQMHTNNQAVVVFPKLGRKREFTHVFNVLDLIPVVEK